MATGVPSIAIDYCSGREVIGDNERGWLIPATKHQTGTWGGAWDYDPDKDALTQALREAYDNPAERMARGERGRKWAQERTWDNAGLAVMQAIERVLERRSTDMAKKYAAPPVVTEPPQPSTIPAGVPVTQFNITQPIQVYANTPNELAAAIAQNVQQQVQHVQDNTGGNADVESN
jgi:hypothetical protein